MKKIIFILALLFFLPIASCASTSNSALKLPSGANEEANKHNEEGISHYKEGHYDVALKHFRAASAIDSSLGEIHFNEAISLDKLGDHGEATKHFKVAQEKANGNKLILESNILLSHVQ